MFDTEAIDVALGLVFVFLLLSLLASAINEAIATLFALRGRNLKNAVGHMFSEAGGEKLLARIFDDAQVKTLSVRPVLNKIRLKTPPAYISPSLFSDLTVRKLLETEENGTASIEELKERVDAMFPERGHVNETFKRMITDSAGNIYDLKSRVAQWYDDTMDHAGEWYRSKVSVMLFVIGLVVAGVLNANTFSISKELASDPEVRRKIVEQALVYAERGETLNVRSDTTVVAPDSLLVEARQLLDTDIKAANSVLGMGWSFPEGESKRDIIGSGIRRGFLGWLITALAVSLGAPFWFDVFGRIIKLRHAATRVASKNDPAAKPVG